MFEEIDFYKVIKVRLSGKGTSVELTAERVKDETRFIEQSVKDNKAFHKNYTLSELKQRADDCLKEAGATACFVLTGKNYEYRRTKKGRLLTNAYNNTLGARAVKSSGEKNLVIDLNDRLYERIGLTVNGKVKSSCADKVKQIDAFCRQALYIAKELGEKTVRITDFGCGKSYLTFALKQTLEQSGYTAVIDGLDLKADVVEYCSSLVQEFGLKNITFRAGDIKDAAFTGDMAVWLHACDTATDYALAAAIKGGTRAVLAVPCCQKELNKKAVFAAEALARYGIVRERMSALFTDTMRALILTEQGYDASLLEYVEEGSLKNLMLRAVKADLSPAVRERAREQRLQLEQLCGAALTLAALV